MDQLYGIGRTAALLGVHPATCRRRERQGKIRAAMAEQGAAVTYRDRLTR